MSDHERYDELAVGHAFSALEPAEEAEFAAHADGCSTCRRTVDEASEVMAQLASAAEPAAPPPELAERLREAVARSPRAKRADGPAGAGGAGAGSSPGSEGPATWVGPEPGPAGPGSAGGVSSMAAARDRRRVRRDRLQRFAPWALTAAALAGLLVVTGWGLSVRAERDQLAASAGAGAQLLTAVGDPSVELVSLRPREGYSGTALVMLEGDQAVVLLDGLPPNDAESTSYVLWATPVGGIAQAVGVFDIHDGRVHVVEIDSMPAGSGSIAAMAVTHEAGNTPPPSGSSAILTSLEPS
jgi:hypothetical protein